MSFFKFLDPFDVIEIRQSKHRSPTHPCFNFLFMAANKKKGDLKGEELMLLMPAPVQNKDE